MIRFPENWASEYGMDRDRVDMDDAISFVDHLKSLQFGYILESQALEDSPPAEEDPALQTEKQLQNDLDSVIDWLNGLQKNGQQTISTQKVTNKIETETGYDFEFD